MSGDKAMRDYSATLPVPEFDSPAFTGPLDITKATVAIVTSAALHRASDDAFSNGDTGFRTLERGDRDLVLGHWSPNFDRSGFTADLNVVYPIERLEEMAAAGEIGAVADVHLSYAGNQPDDVATLRIDSGPAGASALKEAGVEVVILTPV